jgi:hypothetical protein
MNCFYYIKFLIKDLLLYNHDILAGKSLVYQKYILFLYNT